MQSRSLERELAPTDNIIVEFVPFRQSCKLWSRKTGEGVEEKTISCKKDDPAEPEDRSGEWKDNGRSY